MAPRRDTGGGYEDEAPTYVDEDHQSIAEFAAAYLDPDEQDDFVDHLMERRGYQRVQSWGPRADPEPTPDPDPPAGGRSRAAGSRGSGRGRQGYFKR